MQLDQNYKCGIVSLDLCKAFDTVNHQILLEKMYDLGIRGMAHVWFQNYLSDRFQFVHLDDTKSSLKKLSVVFHKALYLLLHYS